MVFGLFEAGKIDILLDKTNFSFGEEINGKVTLSLKKPIKARALKVIIFSETTSTKLTTKGMKKSTSRSFEFVNTLDGEKEYPQSPLEYEFKLKVPAAQNNNIPQGTMGEVTKAISFLSTKNQTSKWFIEAKLDIPGGFDVHKKIQINV